MNLFAKIMDVLNNRWGISYAPVEKVNFLDRTFEVIKGSIRNQSDYDDGWLLALAHYSNAAFDVGCNVGQTSILLLLPEKIQRVVLIDPNPKALAIAAENMIRNHLAHKTFFMCAFAAETVGEDIAFFTTGTGAAGSMYKRHAKTAASINNSFLVPTVSLDWLCEWYQLVPDLVKIDTEGAESKVLLGACALARHRKTKFFIEMHSNPDLTMSDNAQYILDWCQENGYVAWYLKEKKILTSPEVIKHRGRCHLLLLPSEQKFPEYLLPIEQSANLQTVLQSLRTGA